MAQILDDFADGIGTIVLNNPGKRNAFGPTMIEAFLEALGRLRDQGARAVILRAPTQSKVWSAGYDIQELLEAGGELRTAEEAMRRFVGGLQDFPSPVIALIEGGVWGGGCEVAMACDIIVATPDASFGITPARLGIPYPPSGLLTYLNVVPLPVLREMAFTAQPLSAERAERLGFVNHIRPADEIEAFVGDLARQIAANAPLAVAAMKQTLRHLAAARPLASDALDRIDALRWAAFESADFAEGKQAFLAKRKPAFRGE